MLHSVFSISNGISLFFHTSFLMLNKTFSISVSVDISFFHTSLLMLNKTFSISVSLDISFFHTSLLMLHSVFSISIDISLSFTHLFTCLIQYSLSLSIYLHLSHKSSYAKFNIFYLYLYISMFHTSLRMLHSVFSISVDISPSFTQILLC